MKVGKVLGKYKVGKHFLITITETDFTFSRDTAKIAAEATLDGVYVVRTSVPADRMDAKETVRTYKSLSAVEHAFRSAKTVDLKVRPIYHDAPERVRAHVLLCMLAYYVEWHMRRALEPLLFDDEEKAAAEELRESVVAKAQRSPQLLDGYAQAVRVTRAPPSIQVGVVWRDVAKELAERGAGWDPDGIPWAAMGVAAAAVVAPLITSFSTAQV